MGLDRASLPDSILRRITPAERRASGLPSPLSELTVLATVKADKKLEKELQNQIENFLRLRGITVIRSRTDRKTSNNIGTPDLIFAGRGRAVAMEVKLPGRKPTPEQEKFLAALSADGWLVKIVHALDEARAVVVEVEKGISC